MPLQLLKVHCLRGPALWNPLVEKTVGNSFIASVKGNEVKHKVRQPLSEALWYLVTGFSWNKISVEMVK